MKRLTLLRHAEAKADSPGGDFERPLTGLGRQSAARIGEAILDWGLHFDLVIASPARRVLETVAELSEPKSIFDPRVYNASVEQLLEVVRSVDDHIGSLLVVGHNPGMALLANFLTSDLRIMSQGFPTAGLAEISLAAEHWADVDEKGGRLVRFVTRNS